MERLMKSPKTSKAFLTMPVCEVNIGDGHDDAGKHADRHGSSDGSEDDVRIA